MRSENLARVFRQDLRRLYETLEVSTATQVIFLHSHFKIMTVIIQGGVLGLCIEHGNIDMT